MLIRSFKRDDSVLCEQVKAKNGFVLLRDSDGEAFYKKERYLMGENLGCRYESTKIYPKKKTLIKECGFGRVKKYNFGYTMDPVNFMYTALDTNTGEIKNYGAKTHVISPSLNIRDDFLWAGWFGLNPPPLYILGESNVFRSNLPSVDSVDCGSEYLNCDIQVTEDKFQMSYNECLGLLNSFFMQWSYLYPFEAFLTIDSKRGFILNRFTYLKGLIDDIAAKNIGKIFITECDKLVDLFRRNCEKNGRHFKLSVFVGSFGSVLKITPYDKAFSLLLPSNASDQFIQLFKNSFDPNYFMSEEQNLLIGNPTLSNINDELVQRSDSWNM